MNLEKYNAILAELAHGGAHLVAVSKTKPIPDIRQLYDAGQRTFGENKVQELKDKHEQLPHDIEWHLIGHLQRNKVKYIAPFVAMIHSIDSLGLLSEVNKQAHNCNRVIDCLLQIHIAQEETKSGLDKAALATLLTSAAYQSMTHIRICGLMGMATNTEDQTLIQNEFAGLKQLHSTIKAQYFANRPYFKELSMGMSSDYTIALQHGATLVRIGSTIFGTR